MGITVQNLQPAFSQFAALPLTRVLVYRQPEGRQVKHILVGFELRMYGTRKNAGLSLV